MSRCFQICEAGTHSRWHIFDGHVLASHVMRKHCFQRDGLSPGEHHCLKILSHSSFALSRSTNVISQKYNFNFRHISTESRSNVCRIAAEDANYLDSSREDLLFFSKGALRSANVIHAEYA